jgi:peptidoglycan/xylan/chitin deacetylase (PgdA/CDA1 family)
VALTFDDGPGESTAAIIAILARYGVPATFFNIGVNMAARPSLIQAEIKGGYAMGDHTWNHPDLDDLTAVQQAAELDEVIAEQRSITSTGTCAFRPPYGITIPPRSGSRSSAGWACGCGRSTPRTGWPTARVRPTG